MNLNQRKVLPGTSTYIENTTELIYIFNKYHSVHVHAASMYTVTEYTKIDQKVSKSSSKNIRVLYKTSTSMKSATELFIKINDNCHRFQCRTRQSLTTYSI